MQLGVPADPELFYASEGPSAQIWGNDRYTAIAAPYSSEQPEGLNGLVWLSIRRNDRKAIRDWRHLQWIKNEVAGPEREAMEIFPRESRLVDTANQYHLFVLPVGFDIGLGWDIGRVTTDAGGNLTIDGEIVGDEKMQELLDRMGVTAEQLSLAQQRPGVDA
jgi:hypothetical protein